MAVGSKATTSLACFLALNLIFFTLVNAVGEDQNLKPAEPKAPKPGHGHKGTCPINILNLKVCANVLGIVGINIGTPDKQCCPLINGLVDLDAAVCLCAAIKAKVLNINLDVILALRLILNNCGKKLPSGFKCSV